MKAAVCTAFGSIVIKEVSKPLPAAGQVLVRIQATTICAADYRVRGMHAMRWVMGLFKPGKPDILGMEFAGTVESVGPGVTRFRPGDQVFGGTGFKLGAHAEYACVPEKQMELKPANMTSEEAAAVMFGGLTALCFLKKGGIKKGQNVLIYGASGSVGVFAVQLARHFGARVTAVCSTANVELVKSLGADAVIDYTKEDFAKDGHVYDMVFDAVGKAGYSRSARALKRGSTLVGIALSGGLFSLFPDIAKQVWISMTGAAKVVGGVTRPEPGDLVFLKELIEAGQLRTVIDKRYRLDQIADAFDYASTGHKKGHVVILVDPAGA